MADDIKFKIDNLTDNEHMVMYPFLSRDNLTRAQEIKFFNSDVPLRYISRGRPPGGEKTSDLITSTVIYEDELARLIYEYKRIQMLSQYIEKTNIALNDYYKQTTDILGATVINALDRLINYAEDSLNTEIDRENSDDAINEERTFIDRNASPCHSWASKKLNSMTEEFVTDLYLYNRKINRNKTLNMSGENFNSVRHITYHAIQELERLVYYTHELFVDMRSDIISLKGVVIGAVSATRKYLIDLFTILTPPGNIEMIVSATAAVVETVEDYINNFIKKAKIEEVIKLVEAGDPSLLPVIQDIVFSTNKFIGNGVRPYIRKYIVRDATQILTEKLYAYSIRFSLSVAYHYRPYVQTLSIVPFIVFSRILPDNYYPSTVQPKSITVDIYGNRLKYLEDIIPLLFKKNSNTENATDTIATTTTTANE